MRRVRTYVDPAGNRRQIKTISVGDFDGNAWNDTTIGTSRGGIYLRENLGWGTSWTDAVTVA